MNIFESVRFLDEGQQAEEYKAKKAEEEKKKIEQNRERWDRRYGKSIIDHVKDGTLHKDFQKAGKINRNEQRNREIAVGKAVMSGDEAEKEKSMKSLTNYLARSKEAQDATQRHIARHPKQYKESAESIIENLKMI